MRTKKTGLYLLMIIGLLATSATSFAKTVKPDFKYNRSGTIGMRFTGIIRQENGFLVIMGARNNTTYLLSLDNNFKSLSEKKIKHPLALKYTVLFNTALTKLGRSGSSISIGKVTIKNIYRSGPNHYILYGHIIFRNSRNSSNYKRWPYYAVIDKYGNTLEEHILENSAGKERHITYLRNDTVVRIHPDSPAKVRRRLSRLPSNKISRARCLRRSAKPNTCTRIIKLSLPGRGKIAIRLNPSYHRSKGKGKLVREVDLIESWLPEKYQKSARYVRKYKLIPTKPKDYMIITRYLSNGKIKWSRRYSLQMVSDTAHSKYKTLVYPWGLMLLGKNKILILGSSSLPRNKDSNTIRWGYNSWLLLLDTRTGRQIRLP